jgi:hypothetical protein
VQALLAHPKAHTGGAFAFAMMAMKQGGEKRSEYFKLVHSSDHIVQRTRWGHRLSDICDDVVQHKEPAYAKIERLPIQNALQTRRNAVLPAGMPPPHTHPLLHYIGGGGALALANA